MKLRDRAGIFDERRIRYRMPNLVKVFPGTRALDGVDLQVRHGEIHACSAKTAPENRR